MNRAETQLALQGFFDRAACATVADATSSAVASSALADANELLNTHKGFLNENGLLPGYLAQRPNPSFKRTPNGAAEFAR